YLSAANLAKRKSLPQAEAEAALNAGRLVEALQPSESIRIAQAIDLYREAADQGDTEQKQIALNNLGVLYFQLDQIQEALKSFQRIDFAVSSPSTEHLFRYNYGRALERNREPSQAYEQYVIAAKVTPSDSAAVNRAVELAPDVDAVIPICQRVLEGAGDNSLDCLHHALDRFVEDDEVGRLPLLLVRSYTTLKLRRDTFKTEEDFLVRIGERAPPVSRPGFIQLRDALLTDLDKRRSDSSSDRFSWWREPERDQALSSFLEMLAEEDEKEGRFHQAMWRYADAWSIYPQNLVAATRYVSLANDNAKFEEEKQFLNRLIVHQFLSPNKNKATSDDSVMFHLHIALGTALEHSIPCRSGDNQGDPRLPL